LGKTTITFSVSCNEGVSQSISLNAIIFFFFIISIP
jgi:hypothetical protein